MHPIMLLEHMNIGYDDTSSILLEGLMSLIESSYTTEKTSVDWLINNIQGFSYSETYNYMSELINSIKDKDELSNNLGVLTNKVWKLYSDEQNSHMGILNLIPDSMVENIKNISDTINVGLNSLEDSSIYRNILVDNYIDMNILNDFLGESENAFFVKSLIKSSKYNKLLHNIKNEYIPILKNIQ